ncbi:hypothetical protein GOBAR_AA24927 [Gossypium barbadense]|uniref:Uncharacterized protein n=1 Tax=Gossypium barbadense TaxID=3634 RepID=A0A2P5WXC9_GOSBA|nr:hypothetical protein GOBAR_AA24927 [Gossypium barbadense]
MNFAEVEGSAEISINRRAAEGENDVGGGGQSPCGLRVNPKKTNNFSDTGNTCVLKGYMEDEEQEQQEVALCLMMLSRGSACNNDLKCASNDGQFV